MTSFSFTRVGLVLILASILTCLSFPSSYASTSTSACEISAHELLSMDPVEARDILLSLHFDVCVPSSNQNPESEFNSQRYHQDGLLPKRSRFDSKVKDDESLPSYNENSACTPNNIKHVPVIQPLMNEQDPNQKLENQYKQTVIRRNLIDHPAGDTVVVDQRTELMKLYNSTNGGNWKNRFGWGTESPICEWFGISCDQTCSSKELMELCLTLICQV
eukprot:TRINITY_DN6224_c0_g1_i1.p1 TRINITY_DN6224_c0_g1~~TRINITY_DN6224_c0_g1_i1.p1  ORF type:complete len:218 (-),score=31.52 TRINITY_DN6224_c0_g1_i1:79-732(-)